MRHLVVIVLLASTWAKAQVPPAVPGAPAGAALQMQLVALTPELLTRWGYDIDKVMALPPDKKIELQRQLTLLEIGRLRKLELLKKLRPKDWATFVTDQQLITPEGLKLIDDYLATLKDKPMLVPAQVKEFERKDGKPLTAEDFARAQAIMDHLFDGVAAHTGNDMSGEVVVDAHVRNETVYDMTVTNPRTGLSLSVGQLFVDDQHPNAEASPYANITWNKDSKPDSWADYRFKASLGYVDLRSRYFTDDSSVNGPVNQVLQLGQQLGVPQAQLNQASKYVTYDDPYQTHGIIVTSLLTELGRAYNLFGPVDLSWTVGGLVKTMWVAPNAAFDETLGLRVRLSDGMSLGFFGGVAQNASPVGTDIFQQGLASSNIKTGLYIENAPHVGVALWGKVPGVSDLHFSVSGTQRWNETTSVHEAEGSLMTTFYDHPLALRASISQETGTSIEYGRRKEQLELDYHLSEKAQAYLAFQRDHVMYGNATVDSKSMLAGFKIDFGGSGSSLTVDQLMGGKYKDDSPQKAQFQQTLTQINRDLTAAVDIVNKANQAYDGIRPGINPQQVENQLNALSLSLSRLDPATAGQLIDQLGKLGLSPTQQTALSNIWLKTVPPNVAYYQNLLAQLQTGLAKNGPGAVQQANAALAKVDNWSNWFAAHQGDIRSMIGLLTNEQVWDAAVISAARAQLITAMQQYGKVQVPILGHDITLQIDAPAIMAASNILNSRLSPLAPVTDAQADAFLMRQAGRSLGLEGTNFTSAQISNGLFGLADTQIKQQLTQALAPVMAQVGSETPAQLASKVLAALPPNIAAAAQQQYGANLSGLIPANLSNQQLKTLAGQLPDQITTMLEKKYGAQLAGGISQAVSWAGDLLARQVNMTMIQLMLASEELNRLTVDHGQKIDNLDLRMAMRSFDMLDAREKQQAQNKISDLKELVVHKAGVDDAGLAQKFKAHGKEVLQDLQLDPSWPQGLRVDVEESAWMPLLTLYGDGAFFDLVGKMKERYKAKPHAGGLNITFAYRVDQTYGASIWRDGRIHSVKFELGRPKDARDAEFKLSNLDSYVDEK